MYYEEILKDLNERIKKAEPFSKEHTLLQQLYFTYKQFKAEAVEEVDKWISPDKMFEFMDWMVDNGWKLVYSNKLHKRLYVDSTEHEILIHGSDRHYQNLVGNHGKTAQELYEIFSPSAPKQDKENEK